MATDAVSDPTADSGPPVTAKRQRLTSSPSAPPFARCSDVGESDGHLQQHEEIDEHLQQDDPQHGEAETTLPVPHPETIIKALSAEAGRRRGWSFVDAVLDGGGVLRPAMPINFFPRVGSLPEVNEVVPAAPLVVQPPVAYRGAAASGLPVAVSDGTWMEQLARDRAKAIAAWAVVLGSSPQCFDVGRLMLADGKLQDSSWSDRAMQTLRDSLFKKATATLVARASSLTLFMCWCHDRGLRPFPPEEATVYGYVASLREAGSAPTRAARFLEALRFAQYVTGLVGCENAVSARVTGVSAHLSSLAGGVKVRPPLSMMMVTVLEAVLGSEEENISRRVMAGHCLFVLYSRLRWSDALYIEEEPTVQGSFVEANTKKTKTARGRSLAEKGLPVAAPATGVSGFEWGVKWIELRAFAGLRAGPGVPLMPLPLQQGSGWSTNPVSPSQASEWLRKTLNVQGVPQDQLQRVGSHSLRTTLLAWAAKSGMPVQTRRMLGYHLKPGERMPALYGRDSLAAPLRALLKMLADIRLGLFIPDAARDQCFAGPGARPGSESSSASGSGSSSSEEASEPGEAGEELAEAEAMVAARIRCGARQANGEAFIHTERGTWHLGSQVDADRLACGRVKAGGSFKRVEGVPGLLRCAVCFGQSEAK